MIEFSFDSRKRDRCHTILCLLWFAGVMFGSSHVRILSGLILIMNLLVFLRRPAKAMRISDTGEVVLVWKEQKISFVKSDIVEVKIGPLNVWLETKNKKYLIALPKSMGEDQFRKTLGEYNILAYENVDSGGL